MISNGFPEKQGLYDPRFEHDSCGVGFVCNAKGTKSYDVVQQGIEVLERLTHRGAVGADPDTGDGAGVLMQMPHNFLLKECSKIGISLPAFCSYGVGLVFLPTNTADKKTCMKICEDIIHREGQEFLGWREVPVDPSVLGHGARSTMPSLMQLFIKKHDTVLDQLAFERKLYVIRKQIEKAITMVAVVQKGVFYVVTLSSRVLSYKGLLTPLQVKEFFVDLKDTTLESALCLVHSRYSTNTFPTWSLAQPFRLLAHNGEINTVRGNTNWMRARERLFASKLFGADVEKLKPIIDEGGSDSAAIDNVFELLTLSGRSLEHSMMMLIPAAGEHNDFLSKELKEFYKFHACFMEPWDGPAAIAFTDGHNIGAVLDRNGLRPARYIVTKNDTVVMGSEVGVLDIDPADIKVSGRIEPGKLFLIDTTSGRVMHDAEIKERVSTSAPYGKWNSKNMLSLDAISSVKGSQQVSEDVMAQLKAVGYTREDLQLVIKPMAEEGKEPIGSMGNDTPHAFLSKQPQLLYNYFKQLFAQVTNPPIDSIRERLVMSLESFVGAEKNVLEETPIHAHLY